MQELYQINDTSTEVDPLKVSEPGSRLSQDFDPEPAQLTESELIPTAPEAEGVDQEAQGVDQEAGFIEEAAPSDLQPARSDLGEVAPPAVLRDAPEDLSPGNMICYSEDQYSGVSLPMPVDGEESDGRQPVTTLDDPDLEDLICVKIPTNVSCFLEDEDEEQYDEVTLPLPPGVGESDGSLPDDVIIIDDLIPGMICVEVPADPVPVVPVSTPDLPVPQPVVTVAQSTPPAVLANTGGVDASTTVLLGAALLVCGVGVLLRRMFHHSASARRS